MSLEATTLLMMDNGVASSDILLFGLTRVDADTLAPLDCQHYHGLLKWPPFRRLCSINPANWLQASIITFAQFALKQYPGAAAVSLPYLFWRETLWNRCSVHAFFFIFFPFFFVSL